MLCEIRRKHFDTSGKSAAQLYRRAICKTAHAAAHRALGAITGQTSRQLKSHRLATANNRLRVAVPRPLAIRVPEEMST
jgi:hypothetical protein